eukprot:scaffold93775_cov62-Phaeocystis_antarctica.AAC.3
MRPQPRPCALRQHGAPPHTCRVIPITILTPAVGINGIEWRRRLHEEQAVIAVGALARRVRPDADPAAPWAASVQRLGPLCHRST